jgi:co-chaperonin GroES (HSP10)
MRRKPTQHSAAGCGQRLQSVLSSEEKTKGGIIIPDTVKEKPQEGKIIAVGPGGRDETGKLTPLDVKAGDRILFGKWSGKNRRRGAAHHEGERHPWHRRLTRRHAVSRFRN